MTTMLKRDRLIEELRHSGLHCRKLFDRMWQRVVKRGQIGSVHY